MAKLSEIAKAGEIINDRWKQLPSTPTGVIIAFNDDLWVTYKRMLPLFIGNRNAINLMIKIIKQLPDDELEEKRQSIEFGINDEIDAILSEQSFPEELEPDSMVPMPIHEPEEVELGSEAETVDDTEERNRQIVRYKRRHGAESTSQKFGLSTSRVFQIVRDFEKTKRYTGAEEE